MDIDDVLGRVQPARRTVPICLDGSISGRLDDAQARWHKAVLYDAEHNQPSTAVAVADEIAALEDEAVAATVEFVVQSIGAAAWRRLIAEHPPPNDDLEGWRWDPVTFPPAAVAAACVDPPMSEDKATALGEKLSDGQWAKLTGAVFVVNSGDDIPKFGPGTDGRRTSGPSLTTAVPEESLTASSSGNGDRDRVS